ncbi:MAG: DUF4388 domain-containing protein, partial [Myxococcales bacterium]|nr:DUF4388 domain-containing protein [Myxococcales bacterium]
LDDPQTPPPPPKDKPRTRVSGRTRQVSQSSPAIKGSDTDAATSTPPGATGFKYRTPTGKEHGPFDLDGLKQLLAKRPRRRGEMVAVGGKSWRSIDDLPELWDVDRPEVDFVHDVTQADLAFESAHTGLQKAPDEGDEFSHAGQLGRVTITRLLYRLQRGRSSGMLRLVRGDGNRKEIFFRRGEPITVSSTIPEELLGLYLVRKGVITEEQLQHALDRLSEFGGRLGDALVGERILPAHDLFRYLSDQLHDRVLELFGWEDGNWFWFPGMEPPTPSAPLGVDLADLVLRGVREITKASAIRAHFAGREGEHLAVVHGRLTAEDISFSAKESELAGAIKSGMTPQDLLDTTVPPGTPKEAMLWRVLFILTEFEIFRLGEDHEATALPG